MHNGYYFGVSFRGSLFFLGGGVPDEVCKKVAILGFLIVLVEEDTPKTRFSRLLGSNSYRHLRI